MPVYRQVLDPLHHSLGLSSIFAALPLITLFVLLGGLRMKAWMASIIALAVSIIVAVAVYPMAIGTALDSAALGAAFGFFPIMWIVINAIWVYNLTVETGHFDVLRRSFASISDDQRIQAIIIAFCFGALMEALAGFGTPVAISSVMLIAVGFRPLKAATIALVANTAPVAFGALAVPITTLATVTKLPVSDLGSMVGRQTPLLAVFVPLALVFIIDGARGLRQVWPPALVCGVVFGVFQYVASNFWSVPLTDIIAALASALAVLAFTRVWHAKEGYIEAPDDATTGRRRTVNPPLIAGGSENADPAVVARVRADGGRPVHDSRLDVIKAYSPYAVIIVIFVLATRVSAITGVAPKKVGKAGTGLETVTRLVNWPGLSIFSDKGKVVSTTFKLNYLSAAGTLLLIAGIITLIILGIGPARALRTYGRTLNQLKWAIVTVMAVLGLSFVMNNSGETQTLGLWMAGAGGFFAFLSPILGWLGVAVTGSDTSSNSLFGALQVTAAAKVHLSPTLLAAANSSGGVLGKMISPQNLAIAAGAVGLEGKEGDIFRKVFVWSVAFVLFMCVVVYLQSTSVLSWMVI
ncbi:MAG TPA: L-lactate permease [Mycobacteriales bacterium]|nr:L-lactate permease [Mycobacteriales bacterium]